MRMYSADQEATVQNAVAAGRRDATIAKTWAMPVLGMFAMLTLAVGVGGSVYRRRARRGTREVRPSEACLETGPLLIQSPEE